MVVTISGRSCSRASRLLLLVILTTCALTPNGIAESTGIGGRVIDLKGKGVPEVRVHCHRSSAGDRTHPLEVRTDAAGSWTLPDLEPGAYALSFWRKGYRALGRVGSLVTLVAPGGEAEVIMVEEVIVKGRILDARGALVPRAELVICTESGESLRDGVRTAANEDGRYVTSVAPLDWIEATARHPDHGEMVMRRKLQDIDDLLNLDIRFPVPEESLRVTGRVMDSGGRPVDRAQMWLSPKGRNPSDPVQGWSGQDGAFSIVAAAPGEQLLQVTSRETRDLRMTVPAGARDLRIALARTIKVSGETLDPAGHGVRGQHFVFLDPEGLIVECEERETAADGSFLLGGIEPGVYSLLALLEGYRPTEPVHLDLTKVDSVSGVKLTFRDGETISGRVCTGEGRMPIEGASVAGQFEERLSANASIAFGAARYVVVTTDQDGRFSLRGLEPGSVFKITANADGHYGAGEHIRTEVEAGSENVELMLETGGRISGRVLDPHREPVLGARVFWRVGGRNGHAETDPLGGFLLRGVPPGKVEILVRPSWENDADLRARQTALELAVGEDRHGLVLDLPHEFQGRVTGKVTDRSGAAAAGVRLSCRFTDEFGSESSSSCETRADGTFALERLPPGEHTVSLQLVGFLLGGASSVEVQARTGDSLELVVQRLGTIRGVIVDPSVESVTVQLMTHSPEGHPFQLHKDQAWTVAVDRRKGEGRFAVLLRWIPERPAGVIIAADSRCPKWLPITSIDVDDGRDLGKVELESGLTLRGVVRDARGRPVNGATIRIAPDARALEQPWHFGIGTTSTHSDRRGVFELSGLLPETYWLTVKSPSPPLDLSSALQVLPGRQNDLEIVLE